jgi:hypothetical protein
MAIFGKRLLNEVRRRLTAMLLLKAALPAVIKIATSNPLGMQLASGNLAAEHCNCDEMIS